jgi:glycosyltransferase involved in cell wall biosynthesis
VGWYYPESLGGTEVYVAGLAERLTQAGCAVTVAAPDPRCETPRRYWHAGIEVFRYPIPASPTRAEAQGRRPVRGAEHLHRWLAASRPDLVHVHTFVTGLGLHELAAARAAGARTVVTTHSSSLGFLCQRGTLMQWGVTPCDGLRTDSQCTACELQHRGLPQPAAQVLGRLPPALSGALGKLPGSAGTALGMRALIVHNRRRQQELAAQTDRFVVLTDFARRTLLAAGFPADKLVLNRLGLSQRGITRKPGPAQRATSKPVKLGYLGRLDPIKGVEELVAAAAALPGELDFELELCGPPSGTGEAHLRLQALAGRDSRIRLADPIEPNDAPRRLAGYDLLCCPSRCAEGGPTVAIEAHAVGTPVLGTALGGLAELIRDGVDGRLVPPADATALGEALAEAVATPSTTIDRWRANLPPARTLDDVASEYLDLYRELLS